jgi:hypothetical protein
MFFDVWCLGFGVYDFVMARRKRVLLCLCVLIIAVIGFFVWVNVGGSKPAVSVTFIGYTNRPVMFGNKSNFAIFRVVRVTNSGPVAVYVLGVGSSGTGTATNIPIRFMATPSVAGLSLYGFTQNLEPGDSFDTEVWSTMASSTPDMQSIRPEDWVPPKIEPWSVDVFFGHWGPRERFYWVYCSQKPSVRRWIDKIEPKSKISKITLGPVTNQIPTNILSLQDAKSH